MFTKEDFFVHEVYNPPAGEKDIFIFPGSKDYWEADKTLKLKADKPTAWNGDATWTISVFATTLFKTGSPMSVHKVVKFFNEGKERHRAYKILIEELFRNRDV